MQQQFFVFIVVYVTLHLHIIYAFNLGVEYVGVDTTYYLFVKLSDTIINHTKCVRIPINLKRTPKL